MININKIIAQRYSSLQYLTGFERNRAVIYCSKRHRAYKIFCLLLCGLILSGCTSVFFSGASAAYDRYNWQEKIKNQEISVSIDNAFKSDARFRQSNIKTTSFNYQVILIGQVPSEEIRQLAAQIAADTAGVKHVYNFIEIGQPSTASQELCDTWLTTKIKGEIIAHADMDPDQIKVISENNTVYLIGILTHDQAEQAIEIARYTEGVKKVVKIFEYITYSKIDHEAEPSASHK
ncbi:MAG: hypothetical protein A2103_01765 [Gammaproteobacteria bacterium GWF2_41_13]|nr:MAG: hypothetical protein A2103_01765 [Gammaproteobacteria bacterium GWF2_41_13]